MTNCVKRGYRTRARYRRENKTALANAVDLDRLIRELTEGE